MMPTQAELHDAVENQPSNRSGNRAFGDVLAARVSRRSVMRGSLAAAAGGVLGPGLAGCASSNGTGAGTGVRDGAALVGFQPVSLEMARAADPAMPVVSPDYDYQVLVSWGMPIEPGAAPEYDGDPGSRPTADEAARQVGIGHDGMGYFPEGVARGRQTGMLAINHEYGINRHVLGKDVPESLEDVRLSQHVHGVSIVAIGEDGEGGWTVRSSPNARRIHVNTPVTFSGPAAGSPLLETAGGDGPRGTLNNCGSGPTPWGTYLTCEENFNGYFGYTDRSYAPTEAQQRYGFNNTGFAYGWHLFDARFDLANPDHANECNRFGWVVEIDPMDGAQVPVKRTALGRFKHEAIAIAESASGRIAGYMGDDQRFDYCYRYVSNKPWKEALAAGESPLDDGVLYVARFDGDGTGEWLALTMDNPELAARFADQADILVHARMAADIVGATPMDRPEWTTIGTSGEVFWTLTNNSERTEADAANPESPNVSGHILRTVDEDDHLGTGFTWDIYLIASSTQGTEAAFSSPDLAYADPDGRLFIGTDGGQNPQDVEGQEGLQNQLVVFDTTAETPAPRRLLRGVTGDEITGWAMTPDHGTAFVNVQHPGNGDPSLTNFPSATGSGRIPRDSTLVIRRRDGGAVGA